MIKKSTSSLGYVEFFLYLYIMGLVLEYNRKSRLHPALYFFILYIGRDGVYPLGKELVFPTRLGSPSTDNIKIRIIFLIS